MTEKIFPRVDIAGVWSRLNDGLIRLVEYVYPALPGIEHPDVDTP